jgi:hypothetical protein
MNFELTDSKLIVLKFPILPIVGKRYNLPSNGELSASVIRGLSIPYGNEINSAYTNGDSLVIISGTQIANFVLTLADHTGKEIIQNAVPSTFVPSLNNGLIRELDARIDIRSSYIVFTDVTGITTNTGILFNFYYHK